jgi:predicted O-linked N-acetylglucosamine transferase (SPINDLY family)
MLDAAEADRVEQLLHLAETHRHGGDAEQAEALYRRVLSLRPGRHEALLSLAALDLRRGACDRALPVLLRACAMSPGNAEAWDGLGLARAMAGNARGAARAFQRARMLSPGDTGIALRLAEAVVACGDADALLRRATRESAADPANPAHLVLRGALLRACGMIDEAAGVIEAAAALAPDDVLVLRQHGEALLSNNQVRAAEAVLADARRLDPRDASLRNNHAAALIRLQRYREARETLEDLVAEAGESIGVLSNLANATVSLGEQDAGLRIAGRAVTLDPSSHLAKRAVANALAYHPDVTGASLLAAQSAASALLDRCEKSLHPQPACISKRLRVGLLSASLRTHPVGWLTVAGIEALDPAQFEIVCFGQAPSSDPIQRRFATVAAEWHPVAGLPPARVAKAIREAKIDILVDLGGYGDHGMLAACALRPAPVQVKWVGAQAHSTGLAEIDWFITDRWETPEGFERFYCERLWRMPDGYVCYSPPAYAPDVAPSPVAARGHVTFGCFNNLAKVTPRVLDAWSTILSRVPTARLVLKSHQFNDAATAASIRAAFASRGVAAARLDLRGSSPHRALLGEYADIDIVLDPFPYTGGLTTCEALWMGVPTLCLGGETFSARHSTSHMSNVGLAQWCCDSVEAYVRQAVARAQDIAGLAELRADLRGIVATSPLCDAVRFGAHLGDAFRAMWTADVTSH